MSALRPYQVTAIDSALAALSNSGSAVLQMPTGAGKTRAATEIVRNEPGTVWFICHRQEIERQASAAFAAAGIGHGIISPRGAPEYSKRVQVVSVATLARRLADLPPPALVIWDECHHVAAKSWSAIREQLASAKHLGLTATPERLDGKGLAEWFAELVVGPSTRELIDAGYLSDFRYFAPSEPDLTGAKLRAGDYRKEDVAKAMNAPVLIGDAIAEYRAKADGKRALVFCAGVEASKALVERFNAEGIPALHVDGTTPATERDEAVAQLASGEIKVLSNVDVFTEGFDLPAIDAVILLRPTKSLALFLQMIGRVLRRADGKSEALIFDHAGLWLDHDWFDLPTTWSLDGGARSRRLAGRAHGPRRCPECKEVRAERAPVCDCGYEFPTGREIGEYDGDLREMRGIVPEGCVTLVEFANSRNEKYGTVKHWPKMGMPMVGRYVPKVEADNWVDTHPSLRRSPDKTSEFVSKRAFAKMVGGSGSAWVIALQRRGLPAAHNGWVPVQEGLAWMAELNSDRIPPLGVDDPENYESRSSFGVRCGYSAGIVPYWEKMGLVTARNGWVHVPTGLVWVSENIAGNRSRPRNVEDVGAYESFSSFHRRIGIAYKRAKQMQEHLPRASNGWVHIQKGLEWVRDNTSIEIPPEAWPSANDNDAAGDSAAA
ncbi:DEAD/DEAH box helicase [Bosea sp. FBZP-16]|uniref:DEAD/DEAH box helicase n=1 Tax=Bosea sp. FBZP-16 TaxID=2065382 RepID=UPI00131A15F9|nr:DEAD/DEAH box helicase [Bosea sp. FBZP-16]